MRVLRVVKNALVESLRCLHLFASSFHTQCEFYMCCMSDSTQDMLFLCCIILVHVLNRLGKKAEEAWSSGHTCSLGFPATKGGQGHFLSKHFQQTHFPGQTTLTEIRVPMATE